MRFKVMYIDVKPLWESERFGDYLPLPAVGDQVVLNDTYYTVVTRVWTVQPYTAVAIYVREQ